MNTSKPTEATPLPGETVSNDDIQAVRQELGQQVETLQATVIRLTEVNQQAEQQQQQLQADLGQLREEMQELETLRARTNRQLKTRVPLDDVIDVVFGGGTPTEQAIAERLKDDLSAVPEDLGRFTLQLAAAWKQLGATLSSDQLPADWPDDRRMMAIHTALRQFMVALSGLYVPARRVILNLVAEYATAHLAQYDFLSPEETRTVNPAIHKTDSLGGSLITEGLTFAVLRRDTRQTIRYAEVTVNKP